MTDNKIILMGLGASGKSSITSIIFEGKNVDDVKNYHATIQYARKPVSLVKDLQILDCGGQDSFITAFLGEEKAEFIFSNLSVLLWVIDISDSKNVSTSKYYFDTAINNLLKFSPNASVYVFFHKMDLVKDDFKIKLYTGLTEYFKPDTNKLSLNFFATSIFDQSLYISFGKIVQHIIKSDSKAGSVSNEIKNFLDKVQTFLNVAVYSEEGLVIFEEGRRLEELIVPSNLMLTTYEQIVERMGQQSKLVTVLELDNYIFFFKSIKQKYLLTGMSDKSLNFELGNQIFQSLEKLVLKIFD